MNCPTCRHSLPNILWVRYPDNALHKVSVAVCMRGLPLEVPADLVGKPWIMPPQPAGVHFPTDSCADWLGR